MKERSGKDMSCCGILEEALNEDCWLQSVQLIALAALQAVFSLQITPEFDSKPFEQFSVKR